MHLIKKVRNIPSEIKYIFLLFLTTRIVLTIIGVLSRALMNRRNVYSSQIWLDIWSSWDSPWYLNIVNKGYSTEYLSGGQTNYGFFPLYPYIVKGFGLLIHNNYVAGIIISNLCLFVSCILIYKLVSSSSGKETGLRSIKYLFLFPSAFVLSGFLSESLSLMLILACFYYAKKEKWFLVGFLGFFFALARPVGVFAIFPLVYEYAKSKEFEFRRFKFDFLYLFLIVLGVLFFCSWMYLLTGDFLAYVHVKQTGWGHITVNPISLIIGGIFSKSVISIFDSWFALAVIFLLCFFYKKIGFSYWFLGMILVLIPLASGSVSLTGVYRYSSLIFPIFIIFAKLGEKKYVDEILTILLALLQAGLMVFWTTASPMLI